MDSKVVIDHLWKYFTIHSQQRMMLFNFYIVICGVISSAIGYSIQSTKDLISLEVTLCILLTLFSFLFHKLDQRTSFLIKRSEEALASFENQFNTTGINLFSNDNDDLKNRNTDKKINKVFTYGQIFRGVFITMSSLSIILAAYLLFQKV
ncbi:hypothetical protein [Psychrobacter sp. 16-MNA-CIBAN-0192]|uniref:hypothetical protein n=1 Tax=Psychrobacter sp. 16-MNA-CIBAN-0192 TaxID=3140448 RepID=UPI00332EBC83